jgi:dolichol-phosphate mannosyltransferase
LRILVVVPTYNERDNIGKLVEAVLAQPGGFDVLVVDDNSPDGTAGLVSECARQSDRVHLLKRTGPRGFGPSYVDGFRHALSNGYDAVICMDADFSHDPASLPDLAAAIETADFAVGSRYCEGRVSVINWPMHRLVLSVFGGTYVRWVTHLKVADPTAGFRAIKAEVLRAINLDTLRSNGYSFQVETLYRTNRCGFRITEVPIVFTERRSGQSKMSKKIVLEALFMPWRLKLSRFKQAQSD